MHPANREPSMCQRWSVFVVFFILFCLWETSPLGLINCARPLLGQPPSVVTVDGQVDVPAVAQGQAGSASGDNTVAANAEVAEFMKNYVGRGVMADDSHPTPAEQCVPQFAMHDGFQIELVASEPTISQPLFLSWDSRGRMWTVQYRQYQFPAGLKIVHYDQHLRAVFDRIPEPPPLGVSGKDVITVSEDTDGDGRYDTHHDVITGLNIATSVQTGAGGIWVLNPPYLLCYPDGDSDGLPDGDPQVHLSGFGLQDTHAVANSLLWGPDGWLYGANGSTTTATISSAVTKGVSFQGQCIWRYHPTSRQFEIYAEGGGNTFSLDIDAQGRVFSGTNGGGTRGFYYPQGSYSSKNWGKHGPLTNPYAFGYFEAMESIGDTSRFPQAFTIYEGGLFPGEFNGHIIAPNAMQNLVWNSQRMPHGSTYRTQDEEDLCRTSDHWFRPVYAGVGPDGSVYMADWYDTRLSHVSPLDDWHKESGRVYRVFPNDAQPNYQLGDLHSRSDDELIELFSHANKWVRQRAVLELGWRYAGPTKEPVVSVDSDHVDTAEPAASLEPVSHEPSGDPATVKQLEQLVDQQHSLEALWVLAQCSQLSDQRATRWLESPDAAIRRWVVRLLGDQHRELWALVAAAERESDVQVRSQMACSARRLVPELGLSIVGKLVEHSEDLQDLHQPLLLWWGVEQHAEHWPLVRSLFSESAVWKLPIVQQHLLGRLMQRYATEGSPDSLTHCGELVELAPDDQSQQALLVGLLRAFEGRPLPTLPEALTGPLEAYRASLGNQGVVIGLRQRDPAALDEALRLVSDRKQELGLRAELILGLGASRANAARDKLLAVACGATDEPALQRGALVALRNFDDAHIGTQLVARLGDSISAEHQLRDTACRTLATRKLWAIDLLSEVLAWRLRPSDIPTDVAQQLRAYDDVQVAQLAQRALGPEVVVSSEEKLQQMQHWQSWLSEGPGDAAAGKQVFSVKCGICHRLFGEGQAIGPALDAYERSNINWWLIAIIEPSAEIREGFQSYAALTVDGRLVTGMIAQQSSQAVTIRGADNQLTTLATAEIEELRALDKSLMPEDLWKDLQPQQIRDLLAYVTLGIGN